MEKVGKFIMKNLRRIIVGLVTTLLGNVIIENKNNIMEFVANPEVKGSFGYGLLVMITLYLILYGFWWAFIKPYIDEKFNKLKKENDDTKTYIDEKIDDTKAHIDEKFDTLKFQNELLKTETEILKECIRMIQSGKKVDIDEITTKITRKDFHKWYRENSEKLCL